MQKELHRMESSHKPLIGELKAIGQLPQSTIERQDERVWALENIFRN